MRFSASQIQLTLLTQLVHNTRSMNLLYIDLNVDEAILHMIVRVPTTKSNHTHLWWTLKLYHIKLQVAPTAAGCCPSCRQLMHAGVRRSWCAGVGLLWVLFFNQMNDVFHSSSLLNWWDSTRQKLWHSFAQSSKTRTDIDLLFKPDALETAKVVEFCPIEQYWTRNSHSIVSNLTLVVHANQT